MNEKWKESLTEEKIYEIYNDFYKNKYFIRVTENLPEIKNVKNSNICEIGVRYDSKTGNIIVISTIDNLIKGAGGQAVQSMNIMFGFEENMGLKFLSMYI